MSVLFRGISTGSTPMAGRFKQQIQAIVHPEAVVESANRL
jgi:hypothetical protein